MILYGDALNRSHPLARGLAGFWIPLPGRGTGRTFYDLANGYNGTLTNGPTWAAGPNGFGAIDFDTTDDFVEVSRLPSVVLTDTPGFAISGWFRPRTIDSTWRTVASKRAADGSNNSQLFLTLNGGYSCPTNGLTMFTNFAATGGVGTNALTVGRWYWYLASHLGTGAGGNALWVWSEQGGWETIVAGTDSPTVTGINTDLGVNPVRFSRFSDSLVRPLGGDMGPQLFWTQAMHTQEVAMRIFDQFRRGFPNLLRRTVGPRYGGFPVAPASTGFYLPAITGLGW